MKVSELQDKDLRKLFQSLIRHPESDKAFYYAGSNPLGQQQYGGYVHVFTRQEVLEEYKKREL